MVRDQIAREQRRRRTLWTSVTAVLLLFIAGMIGYGIYVDQRPTEYQAPPGATDSGGIPIGSGPVTIDVYSDFMCPACRQFQDIAGNTLDELVAENKATVVYHPIAILDRYSTTQYSTRSAAASACAAEVNRFPDFAKELYARQPSQGGPGLSDEELASIGSELGFGDTFSECVSSKKYRSWTTHITDEAGKRGVHGTPTVYVNGNQVNADPAAIRAAVDSAQ